MEAAKDEGIRAWGKQFYVLAPCRVDFMSHFYWPFSKRESWQQTHSARIMLNFWQSENYCRISLVARPWQQRSLNHSHCTTQNHRLGAMISEIATIVSRCQSFVWDSWKVCSVFQVLHSAWCDISRNLNIFGTWPTCWQWHFLDARRSLVSQKK